MSVPLPDWRARARTFRHEGHEIAYWREGAGRPLLLIHGFPTSSHDWSRVWPALAAERELIACDMLGFGLSGKPRGGYSIHAQADLQAALLDHLGVSECDLLLHDYGVSVGQEMLARQAEGAGLEGLGAAIFLNGGIFPFHHRPRPIQKLCASPLGFLVGALMTKKRFAKSFAAVFGPETRPTAGDLDDFWTLIAEKGGNRIFHKLLHYMGDRVRHAERWVGVLETAQARIGLINGARDPVSGAHVFDHWRAALPGAKARLLERVGHYPQWEAPEAVAETTLAWLEAFDAAREGGTG